MTENDALRMVKRRARDAGLPASTCNHTFRATCITNFRRNGGSRSKAAQLACHESERTTRMYDRSDDPVTLDEIERVNYRTKQKPDPPSVVAPVLRPSSQSRNSF